ncbi:hypothetical protein GCM10028807_49840 [Spirosoma daeguense]
MNWQELQHETLDNLIEILKLRSDAEAINWANAAFENIVFRYRKDILEKCTVMCRKNHLTDTDAEIITNRVFSKIYKHPIFDKTFCKQKSIEKCLQFYLYKIARNELFDYASPDETVYNGSEKVITSVIDPSKEYNPEKLKELQMYDQKLDEIFSVLTPAHKIIYLTYLYHEKEGKYLPDRLRKELRDLLNLTQSTIRVYKMQAIELIKANQNGR